MKELDFQAMREQTTADRFAMCDNKSVAYTQDTGDRLYNFKALATLLQTTPERVLAVYVGKHILAMFAYLEKGVEPSDGIDSTIDDIQNYLDLIRARVRECID